MMGETVEQTRDGPVANVLFRGGSNGTISNKGAALLADAVETLLEDPTVGSIILSGAEDGIFIRHADLDQIARAARALHSGAISGNDFIGSPFQRLCATLDNAQKPVIAAINGACMGGGLEIALACTLRIAAANVEHIGLPEIRIDIPPGGGGPQRLARLIGAHRSRLFVLEGGIVDVAAAQRLGIVDEISVNVIAAASAWGHRLAARSGTVVAEIMRQFQPADREAIDENARGFATCLAVYDMPAKLDAVVSSGQRLQDYR